MLRQRMYCLVLRQLSPIQKGVQSAHAVVEYANEFGGTEEWERWSKIDKTIIMLDGGRFQDLQEMYYGFKALGCDVAAFDEEDLNGLTTCVCLLADERVWDRENWPDWDVYAEEREKIEESGHAWAESKEEWLDRVGGEKTEMLRAVLGSKRLAM